MKHILLADEDPDILLGLRDYLDSRGYIVTTVTTGQDAAFIAVQNKVSLVLICSQLAMDGFDKIREIQKGNHKIPVIIMTSSMEDMHDKKLLPWVHGWLRQPIEQDELNMILTEHIVQEQGK